MSEKITAFQFDASTVEPQKPNDPLPKGWYDVEVADASIEATKGRGAGRRAVFEYTVLTGDHKGRKVWGGINVKNSNAEAEAIGQREMSSLCHATGVIRVSDLREFVGKQLQIKVGFGKDDYADRNEIKGYKALEGASNSAPAPVGIPQGPPPIAAAPTPPPAPVPVAPPVAPPAPPVVVFPPEGWQAHPSAPGYYYCGQEVLTEADLRAKFAAPAVPAVPVAPPAVDTSVPPWKR